MPLRPWSRQRSVPGVTVQWHAGGMLTGPHTRTITADWREKVMASDQRIAEMTGQPFGDAYFNGLLNDIGAPLDSEPPTTALLAAEALNGQGLEMLAAEQKPITSMAVASAIPPYCTNWLSASAWTLRPTTPPTQSKAAPQPRNISPKAVSG